MEILVSDFLLGLIAACFIGIVFCLIGIIWAAGQMERICAKYKGRKE
jgi:hypothetical protein